MNNNNGKGMFYAMVGVASLVVAIIGATFAYFSASATPTGDSIAGSAQAKSNLTLTVNEVFKTPTSGVSHNLVPSNLSTNGTPNMTAIGNAINAKCEAGSGTSKYVGCHLYKITAGTSVNLPNVNIYLSSLSTTGVTAKAKWNYAVFTATESSGSYSSVAAVSGVSGNLNTAVSNVDMHKGATLTTSGKVYYLIIWIENDTANAQDAGNSNDVVGSYSGSVTMSAAGGKISATFATS